MILMFWNKFINSYCDFAWIFRISRLCFQKSVPRFSPHKFLVLNWQFWKSFSTSRLWRKKLARRTLRGSKVVSSDLVVEPLVEMMKRVNPAMMWRTLMLTWVVQGCQQGTVLRMPWCCWLFCIYPKITSFDCCILRGITDTFQDSVKINNRFYITSGWFQMALIQIHYFCDVNWCYLQSTGLQTWRYEFLRVKLTEVSKVSCSVSYRQLFYSGRG